MNWDKLLSQKRLGREKDTSRPGGGRTWFEADVDKIIYSGPFRRLGRKTQVHPLAANDHVHTRLTHSMEVAQVGRGLGKELGTRLIEKRRLPKNLHSNDLATVVQAACLAHDLGNPPFGHAGEEAMAHWFEVNGPEIFKHLDTRFSEDLIKFEGNAQGFRILTQTENHLFKGGLRLTYATLGTFQKYPWVSSAGSKKFGAFISEAQILEKVADELGLVRKGTQSWCRHPLAYLVEAADDICYAIIDLEDAVELKILSYDKVENFLLKSFPAKKRNEIKSNLGPKSNHRVNLARLRGPIFDLAVSGAIDGFMNSYDAIMTGSTISDVFHGLKNEDPRRTLISDAKSLARDKIYTDYKKIEIELGCYAIFDCLLTAFCEAAINQARVLAGGRSQKLLRKSDLVLKLLGDHAPDAKNTPPKEKWTDYNCLRRVTDFVSGMTDNYAVYVASQIQGAGFSNPHRS